MFHDNMPMAQVLIELDEGVRMVGNMADVTSEDYREDPALLKISQRVEVVFEGRNAGVDAVEMAAGG